MQLRYVTALQGTHLLICTFTLTSAATFAVTSLFDRFFPKEPNDDRLHDHPLPGLEEGVGIYKPCSAAFPCDIVVRTDMTYQQNLHNEYAGYEDYKESKMLVAFHPDRARRICGNAIFLKTNGDHILTYMLGSCSDCVSQPRFSFLLISSGY